MQSLFAKVVLPLEEGPAMKMIYEATLRKGLRSGKYFFILRRDGKTIRVGDARYLTRESAARAACEAAFDAHARAGNFRRCASDFRITPDCAVCACAACAGCRP